MLIWMGIPPLSCQSQWLIHPVPSSAAMNVQLYGALYTNDMTTQKQDHCDYPEIVQQAGIAGIHQR